MKVLRLVTCSFAHYLIANLLIGLLMVLMYGRVFCENGKWGVIEKFSVLKTPIYHRVLSFDIKEMISKVKNPHIKCGQVKRESKSTIFSVTSLTMETLIRQKWRKNLQRLTPKFPKKLTELIKYQIDLRHFKGILYLKKQTYFA